MLHRSFKPAKCKTALKLAASRLKLWRNKREALVKQLKRELAQLLESGQDQTARIRVEHMLREEKTVAAYELIELYCELIATRLPIIESQKLCPADLKEAIASVIFASPRCADVPELMEVRKHFAAKYGKEFVSSAVELHPDCGVSRQLVEKLSAKAPDGPTKIKILSAIADEHNVRWEPKSFGEKDMKSPEDLLNGPSTFEQATKMHMEPYNDQKPLNNVDKGPSNYQVPSKHHEKHDASINTYSTNSSSSPPSQNIPSTDVDANEAMPSGTSHPDMRPLGTRGEGMECRHPYAGDGSDYALGRQSWNMEFKDATTAAQAAAESAELASRAARAAAELSSQGRITRQHSTESPKAAAFQLRNEGLQNHTGSKIQSEQLAKYSVNSTFSKRNSEKHDEQSDGNEQDDLAGLAERFYNLKHFNKSSRSTSSKSSIASVDDHPFVNDIQMDDRHSQKSSAEFENSNLLGSSVKRESRESNVEFVSTEQDRMNVENVGYFEEVSIRKRSSGVYLHSRTLGDDHNVGLKFNPQKSVKEPDENPFSIDEGKFGRNPKETNSYDNATVVFDDYSSDNDDSKFDTERTHDGQKSNLYLSSQGRNSSSHLFEHTDYWSPRQNADESLVKLSSQSVFASEEQSTTLSSANNTVDSQPADFFPVTFDDSDGPGSESEELGKSKLIGSTGTGFFPHEETVCSRDPEPTQNDSPRLIRYSLSEKENMGSSKRTVLRQFSPHSDVVEVCPEGNQGHDVNAKTPRKFSYGDLYTSRPFPKVVKSQLNSHDLNENLQTSEHLSVQDDVQIHQSLHTMKDTTPIEKSSLEFGKALSFGKLTGGLRNKGYKHPPYHRNPSNNSSFSKQTAEDTTSWIEQSSPPEVDSGSGAREQEPHNQIVDPKLNEKTSARTPVTYSDSGTDDSDDELSHPTSSGNQVPYNKKTSIEEKVSSRTYFDSDDSDSDLHIPEQTLISKTRSGTGFAQRTKASPSNSNRNSYSKATVRSESSATADHVVERKSSSTGSRADERKSSSSGSHHAADTRAKPQSQTKSLDYLRSSERQSSSEKEASKIIPQSKWSSHGESFSRRSYTTNTQENLQSWSKSSDYWAGPGQPRSTEQETSKQVPESRRPLRKESLNSSASPPKTVQSGGAESSKVSSSYGQSTSRENSVNKAFHVHPKLPDYDALTAHLLSLRQNRQ